MKKIPRDLEANELIKLLHKRYNYEASRQAGSHIRLTTTKNGEHHITIPNHNQIKLGTLSSILTDIASHLNITKQQLLDELF
jgi:predicted RNA binding protein YcfA (HicA-like mRNA interferase family)